MDTNFVWLTSGNIFINVFQMKAAQIKVFAAQTKHKHLTSISVYLDHVFKLLLLFSKQKQHKKLQHKSSTNVNTNFVKFE